MSQQYKKYLCIGFYKNGNPCHNKQCEGLYCKSHIPPKNNMIILDNVVIDLDLSNIKIPLGSVPIKANVKLILDTCAICLNPVYVDDDAKLKCDHRYHFKCVCDFRKMECPTCKGKLESPLINNNLLEIINDRAIEDHRQSIDDSYQELLRNEQHEENDIIEDLEQIIIDEEQFLEFLHFLHHLQMSH